LVFVLETTLASLEDTTGTLVSEVFLEDEDLGTLVSEVFLEDEDLGTLDAGFSLVTLDFNLSLRLCFVLGTIAALVTEDFFTTTLVTDEFTFFATALLVYLTIFFFDLRLSVGADFTLFANNLLLDLLIVGSDLTFLDDDLTFLDDDLVEDFNVFPCKHCNNS